MTTPIPSSTTADESGRVPASQVIDLTQDDNNAAFVASSMRCLATRLLPRASIMSMLGKRTRMYSAVAGQSTSAADNDDRICKNRRLGINQPALLDVAATTAPGTKAILTNDASTHTALATGSNVHQQTAMAARARQQAEAVAVQPNVVTQSIRHQSPAVVVLDDHLQMHAHPSAASAVMPNGRQVVQRWRTPLSEHATRSAQSIGQTEVGTAARPPAQCQQPKVVMSERCYGALLASVDINAADRSQIPPSANDHVVLLKEDTLHSKRGVRPIEVLKQERDGRQIRLGTVRAPERSFLSVLLFTGWYRLEAVIPSMDSLHADFADVLTDAALPLQVNIYGYPAYADALLRQVEVAQCIIVRPTAMTSNTLFDSCVVQTSRRVMRKRDTRRQAANAATSSSEAGGSTSNDGGASRVNWEVQTTSVAHQRQDEVGQFLDVICGAHDLPEADVDARMATQLYPHQRQALKFMILRERDETIDAQGSVQQGGLWRSKTTFEARTCFTSAVSHITMDTRPPPIIGGLLADDMGLGKTATTIALLLHDLDAMRARRSHGQRLGGTLIVCPLSVISNWEDQLTTHLVKRALTSCVYHGSDRISDPTLLARYDVVVTTYNLVAIDYSKSNKTSVLAGDGPDAPLHRVQWYRVVLDEAHMIKESKTMFCQSVCHLTAERRWCLTGTPVQNRLNDLYSLLKFLRVKPFDDQSVWRHSFGDPIKRGRIDAIRRLQASLLLKYLALRRTKESKIHGRPLLTLPDKEERIVWLELASDERTLYDRLANAAREWVKSYARRNVSFMHVLEMMLRLRQACVHPMLCRGNGRDTPDTSTSQPSDAPVTQTEATRILELQRATGDDVCVQCMKSTGERPSVSPCRHLLCRACTEQISTAPTPCPSCQQPLIGSALVEVADIEADIQSIAQLEQPGAVLASTKVDTLLRSLQETRATDRTIKSVVFSQWTSLLDIIDSVLSKNAFGTVRLQGNMSRDSRNVALQRFGSDSSVTVMLISLRAGGVGLNLTMAQHVYLMDPYWNPAVEQQAVDRIHRLGQQRPVTIMRLLIKGSIEERVLRLQQYKKRLADLSLASQQQSSSAGAQEVLREQRIEELKFLLE